MLELLFLLLPVAAGYGYIMGRNSVRQAQRKTSSILSKHYFKGLNFLLSDQPDKAVDTLMKMVDVNNDNAETHIAMGNFFRHRGELDRAIKVHQNLVDKDGLNDAQREQSLFELGRDYVLAGFLERAESSFLRLLDSEKYFVSAQQQLFSIYQTTKEWDRAVELAEGMVNSHGDSDELSQRIAHFYCEQAQIFINKQEFESGERCLQKAIFADEHGVRPWLMLGQMAVEQKQFDVAFDYLKQVPQRDVIWFSEAVPLLWQCAEKQENWQELKDLLTQYSEKCATAYLATVSLLSKEVSPEEAAEFLLKQLQKSPSMKGFHKLLGLYAQQEDIAQETLDSLSMLQELILVQINQRPKYRCHSCGFSGRRVHWLCPSCKSWGLMKPIKGLDGD